MTFVPTPYNPGFLPLFMVGKNITNVKFGPVTVSGTDGTFSIANANLVDMAAGNSIGGRTFGGLTIEQSQRREEITPTNAYVSNMVSILSDFQITLRQMKMANGDCALYQLQGGYGWGFLRAIVTAPLGAIGTGGTASKTFDCLFTIGDLSDEYVEGKNVVSLTGFPAGMVPYFGNNSGGDLSPFNTFIV